MKNLPKLSIVTPSFNQGHYLEETITTVLSQNYPNLEYIIVDGGSKDQTVEVIKKYERHLAYWVSEPDRGQVHALNKGLAKATGDLFAFINSDDLYLPGAFTAVLNYFSDNPRCNWLCGDTIMFGEGHRTYLSQAIVPKSAAHALSWAAHCAQPGMFWKRQIVTSGFKEEWPYDFDHEMYIRLLFAGYECEHLPVPLAAYRLHAASKTVAEGHRQEQEFDLLAEHYGPQLQGAGKRWCRATQYIRKAYKLGQEGKPSEGASWLFKALYTHPEGLANRPFWGALRMLVKNGSD